MNESEMGYRGSKSIVCKSTIVKEQRVDGNLPAFAGLRYTLKGFERKRVSILNCNRLIHCNSYTKIPSKQFNINKYSTLSYLKLSDLNPDIWSGLIDGEGSFSIIVTKDKIRKLGWRIELKFQMALHIKDINLLYLLQEYLHGTASINLSKVRDIANYSINSLKGWELLITHLDRYPLSSQKYKDYLLIKKAFYLIKEKVHLTHDGLNQIINIKAPMNLGLSDTIKSEFTNYTPVERPKVRDNLIITPYWLSGFICAKGNFYVRIPSTLSKSGYRIQLRFRITQHDRHIKLMEKIVSFMKCGKVYKYGGKSAVSFTIVDLTDITNNFIPFIEKHFIIGIKYYDYLYLCKIYNIMVKRMQLTPEGIESIRNIKCGMNRSRNL